MLEALEKVMNLVVYVASDLVVTGYNPENADMCNPRGARYGDAYYVMIEYSNGARQRHKYNFINNEIKATCYANKISKSLENNGAINPEYWEDTDPCYGSDAYVNGNYELRQMERERFDDTFGF